MKANAISQPGELAGTSPQHQTSPLHRILVVDDDGDIRRLNAEVLSHSGYHVDAAEDGAVAWDALQLNRYDLLVTDHTMPNVSGVELLKKVRAARMALPVILATGSLPKDEFAQQPWLQPTTTLLKPYSMAELVGTVKEVLRATDNGRAQMTPPPNGASPPSAVGLQRR